MCIITPNKYKDLSTMTIIMYIPQKKKKFNKVYNMTLHSKYRKSNLIINFYI